MRERGKTFAFIGIMLLAKVKALAVIKLPLNKRALRNSISKSVLRVAIQEIVCYLTDGRATFFCALFQAPLFECIYHRRSSSAIAFRKSFALAPSTILLTSTVDGKKL